MGTGAIDSPLMGLPGEVRNRIYRYALVEERGTYIRVTATGMTEPSLLTSCKVIRQEAAPIFYAENTFEVDLSAFDCSAACFFEAKSLHLFEEYELQKPRTRWIGVSIPNWKNLITWLQYFHEGRMHECFRSPTDARRAGPSAPFNARIIGRMFHTVHLLRDLSWTVLERVLLEDRELLGHLDARWFD